MQYEKISPTEAEHVAKAVEQENERASYEALIDYVVQSARDAQMFCTGESVEEARRHLCQTIFN
ncbi:hypothetical protein [Phaeobacter porticola]|uniref:Uncharacterized protein n=1 Tax=Phaeobacter porticola TaxID=1844006 RepID=A0A1L3I2M7_9RHOB|nr:hypothetical protein [Phaeobacter porticola]APG46370.1 hypothetical protein PhaeoP97_00943 [Phaeobacter porticola]